MSEIRYNILKNRYVIVANNRALRPNEQKKEPNATLQDKPSPFEYGYEHLTPKEIYSLKDRSGKWRCRVVPNLYNALAIESSNHSSLDGMFETIDGFGAHEVVIETPHSNRTILDFEKSEIVDILSVYQARVNDLKKDFRIKHISIFKNHNFGSGATLKHPHSQILALPYIPPKIEDEIKILKKYHKEHKRSLLEDMISEEKRVKSRILFECENFVAFTPFASMFPFEVMIVAKSKFADIYSMDEFTKNELASMLKRIFSSYSHIEKDISFNMILNTKPINTSSKGANFFRFYIELTPRIYNFGGFEIGSGDIINPISPEKACEFLKRYIDV